MYTIYYILKVFSYVRKVDLENSGYLPTRTYLLSSSTLPISLEYISFTYQQFFSSNLIESDEEIFKGLNKNRYIFP